MTGPHAELLDSLHGTPRAIPSSYLYDSEGGRLFERVTRHRAYYLFWSERQILASSNDQIAEAIGVGSDPIQVFDLGSGTGEKAAGLVRRFAQRARIAYVPVDIDAEALTSARTAHDSLPHVQTAPIAMSYLPALDSAVRTESSRVILFLGGTIGAYEHTDQVRLLAGLRERMTAGDHLLIGLDSQKDPRRIEAAYQNRRSERLVRNALHSVNRRVGGTFQQEYFDYRFEYSARSGLGLSLMISNRDHAVSLGAHSEDLWLRRWEAIEVCRHQKYTEQQVAALAQDAGFEVKQTFSDADRLFWCSVWRAG